MPDPSFVPPHLLGTISVHDAAEAEAHLAAGATLQRHAHTMRLSLPVDAPGNPEFRPFAADASAPVPWAAVIASFEAAYPPDHPDYLAGGADLIDSYLLPYTVGAELGPLICPASALAVRDGYVYGGILVVDRPDEGAWVCDIWRDPDRDHAGTGAALLRWAASRLDGYPSLGLVVTVGNEAALRAYQRVGFTIEATAWTIRLP